MGEVKSLICKENVIPSSSSIALLLKFDNDSIPKFYNTDPVPIYPLNLTSCIVKNSQLQQAHLKLSNWAVIIHKSQELTTQNTIVDFGPTEKVASLVYVANFKFRVIEELRFYESDKLTWVKFSF